MKYVSSYERFLEKRNIDTSLEMLVEKFGMLLEADEAPSMVPTKVQSDKEIIEELPEESKTKIEELIGKYFPETKGKVDFDKAQAEAEGGAEGGEKKNEVEKTNEGIILTAVTIVSLIPVAMEAVGSLSNFIKRKFGINLDEKQMANIKKINDAIAAMKNISNQKEGKFMGKSYNQENWKEISSVLAKELATPDLEYGKGYDTHGHEEKANEEVENDAANVKAEQIKEINKYKHFRDKLFGTNFGNWLKAKGHDLHHAYTAPIRGALWLLSKVCPRKSKLRDEKVREKIANILYAITMVGLAGYGIMASLGGLVGVGEVAGIILKGIEGGVNTAELRKQALTAITGGTV